MQEWPPGTGFFGAQLLLQRSSRTSAARPLKTNALLPSSYPAEALGARVAEPRVKPGAEVSLRASVRNPRARAAPPGIGIVQAILADMTHPR